MDMFLIHPQLDEPIRPEDAFRWSENLGAQYLVSLLQEKGNRVWYVDAGLCDTPTDDVCAQIIKAAPDILAFSLPHAGGLKQAREILDRIKTEKIPVVIAGGNFASFAADALIDAGLFDYVLRGEGENVLPLLIDDIQKGKVRDRPGLIGRLVKREDWSVPCDLGKPRRPCRPFLKRILTNDSYTPINVNTSRGCYARCRFCSIAPFNGYKWRARPVDDVVNELAELRSLGVQRFRFTDDNFIGPPRTGPDRAKAIAERLQQSGHQKWNTVFNCRVNDILDNRDVFRQWARIGLEAISIGVESAADSALKRWRKGITREQIYECVQWIDAELAIRVQIGFMMFDPWTTIAEMRQNLSFLEKVKQHATVDNVCSEYLAFPGTDAFWRLESEQRLVEVRPWVFDYELEDRDVRCVRTAVRQMRKLTFPVECSIGSLPAHDRVKRSLELVSSYLSWVNTLVERPHKKRADDVLSEVELWIAKKR